MKKVEVPSIPKPKPGNLFEMVSASKRANKVLKNAVLKSGGNLRVEKSDSQGKYTSHILSKSARKGVNYQLTSFDRKGPTGHMDIKGSLKENADMIVKELPKSQGSIKTRLFLGGTSKKQKSHLRSKATSGSRGG